MKAFFALAMAVTTARAYWLMGIENFITTERIDPIVNPGKISGHAHSVLGGSNFRFNTNTAALRQSECTSIPIPQDKSAYWFPHLYYEWNNGSFSSLTGGAVIYYLFDDKPGTTTAFPDDFRMLSGDPTLRTFDANSAAQKAVSFLCLDFNGKSTTYHELPPVKCPSGVRAQINFPSCWDGKNLDSPDHKSHVAFRSGGPDSGDCKDPKYPVNLPRIFLEVYWATGDWDKIRDQAKNPNQPFVYAHGDPTGYGYHADFLNGWAPGVLQNAVDKCHCNIYGDPACCVQQGIFDMKKDQHCRITKAIDEQTTGTLSKLPGNNPVQPAGKAAVMMADPNTPALIEPIYAYTGDQPTKTGAVVSPGQSQPAPDPQPSTPSGGSSSVAGPSSANIAPPAASSSSAAAPGTSSSSSAAPGNTSASPAPTNVLIPLPTSSPAGATSPTSSPAAGTTKPAPTPAPSPTQPHQANPPRPTLPFPFPFPIPAYPKPGHGHHSHGSGDKACSRKRELNVELEARSSALRQHRRSRQRRAVVEN